MRAPVAKAITYHVHRVQELNGDARQTNADLGDIGISP
jgi:hypothetical protein